MTNRCASIKVGLVFFIALLLLQPAIVTGETFSRPINNKAEFYSCAKTLPLSIRDNDDYQTILKKIEKFLNNYKTKNQKGKYSLEATKQALYGCQSGGFGIGAILVDPKGNIVERAYNEMRQQARSDLHGEMNLLTKFETKRTSPLYKSYQLPPGYIVYSSAEPCPMCLIRLASAGVNTYYVFGNDDDSMSRHLERLPQFWKKICEKHPCAPAEASPELSRVAYLLFYTFVFFDKSPKELAK
jgi:tRNA(Arg) A34 adenosine deaminase TadA